VVHGYLTIIFLLCRTKRNCVLFMAKGNRMIAEWSVYALATCVVVCICRKFEKHWFKLCDMYRLQYLFSGIS
jgi:hypothetical protein